LYKMITVHTVKYTYVYPRIFLASFPHFNGIGSVYVCIGKSTPGSTLHRGPALQYFVDLLLQTYTEPVQLKYGQLATKCPPIYGYFYSVYTTDPQGDGDDENAGYEEAERRQSGDVTSRHVDGTRQSAVRHEEQQERGGDRLANALREHALVEQKIALSWRVQFRIM